MRAFSISVALGIVSLAAAAGLNLATLDGRTSKPYDVLHVPSGAAARVASLGNRTFASDVYWLAAVQYIGDARADARGWDRLLPLVDLVTDLDPRHGYAYQTAGIVLSAAGRLDESNAILEKGIVKGPPYWSFPYYIAFNHWFYLGDLATAAKYAEIAARRPGASANISHLALALASKSGTPEQIIDLLRELRAAAGDDVTATRLDEQIKLATLERDAQRLERLAEDIEKRRGWPITSLEDLVLSGGLRDIPVDPFGGRYYWDAAEKKVHSSANAFRFGLTEGSHLPRFQYKPPSSAKTRELQ